MNGYVLEQSLRLYSRAMGDDSIDLVEVSTDPETQQESVFVRSRTEYDPSTAKATLQLIGNHRDISAFTQTIEHTHPPTRAKASGQG